MTTLQGEDCSVLLNFRLKYFYQSILSVICIPILFNGGKNNVFHAHACQPVSYIRSESETFAMSRAIEKSHETGRHFTKMICMASSIMR